MNPLQKLLWFLVFLAGLATAAAGLRVLAKPAPPIPVLGDSGLPPGDVRLAWIDNPACTTGCAETRAWLAGWNPSASIVVLAPEAAESLHAFAGPAKAGPDEIVLPVWGDIGEWSLTAEDGKPHGSADLAGKIWISNFIFTRCATACPAMCEGMESVAAQLPDDPRLRFVSFSVDAGYDTPEVLREYKAKWKGDPAKWKFVTGVGVYKLAYEKFKVNEARPNPDATPGNEFFHSQRFTLVDERGRMRGLYQYDYEDSDSRPVTEKAIVRDALALLKTPEKVIDHVHDRRLFLVDKEGKLRGVYEDLVTAGRDARRLALAPAKLVSIRSLPAINAALNFTSFLFLSAGLAFILNRKIFLHKAAMTAAFLTSILFLASYVTYHLEAGSVKYAGTGWMRTAYFGVLLSHTVLAAAVAPLALITIVRAWRESYDRHVTIARWTLPIWMYVSLTGILVYLMLYRM